MATTPPPAAVTPSAETMASTFGWDMAYAVRVGDINARIAATRSYPTSFSQTLDGTAIAGTFAPWTIATGGGGSSLLLDLPFQGTLTASGQSAEAIAGIAPVYVELNYLDEVAPSGTSGGAKSLVLAQPDVVTPTGSNALFSLGTLSFTTSNDIISQWTFKAVLEQWLRVNAAAFQVALATISLPSADLQTWLTPTPTALSYAYASSVDGSEDILAVLAMTNGRTSQELDQQISINAIPAGADAALLISPYVLLEDIILPSLPSSFQGLSADSMTLATQTPTLTLSNACQLAPFSSRGSSYTPTLTALSIAFEGTQLSLQSTTSVPVGEGVTAWTSNQTTNGMTVTTGANGAPQLGFTQLAPPVTSNWTTTDPSVQQDDDDIAMAVGICTFIATILTGGVAGLLIALTGALISGIIANLPTFAAALNDVEPPGLDLLAINATAAVKWSQGADFQLAAADLVDSLRLSGSPWAAASGATKTGAA